MKWNAIVYTGLALAGVLFPTGCSRDSRPTQEATEAPEKTAGARGSGPAARSGSAARAGSLAPRAAPLPASPVILPEGTPLVVRTTTALSTKTQQAGQSFTAHLEQPLALDGREIAPRGAEVQGRIVDSDQGGRVKGLATLAVQMTRLHTTAGDVVDISTSTVTSEARSSKTKDAVKIGIGSGVGAAIGAIAGGGKGAAIGAAAGAGAGTGVVLATHGDSAVIPSETVLHFVLRSPVTIAQLR